MGSAVDQLFIWWAMTHLAVIPDGNRRWASERQSSLGEAYAIGFCNVIELTLLAQSWGVSHLTFFGLSFDNLTKRPQDQVGKIFRQMTDSLAVASPLLRDSRIRINFYGNLKILRADYRKSLASIAKTTSTLRAPKLHMNILVNYSMEWDLEAYSAHLRTRAIPPCDLVFRSGRAKRISGFLPIQTSHAELQFSDALWPDVDVRSIKRTLSDALQSRSKHGL